MRSGNKQPSIDAAEHIGPDDTGDGIEAKRVASYVWDGAAWQRMSQPGGGGLTNAELRAAPLEIQGNLDTLQQVGVGGQTALIVSPINYPITAVAVTSVNDTITSTELISSNADRREVEFYNTSAAILYLLKGTGTASATNFTAALGKDDYYVTDAGIEFQGVWASDAGGSVLITEST